MKYSVKIAPFAVLQLEETVKYISEILLVPEIAVKWLDKLEKEISALDFLPNRFPLTEEEPWRARGIRKFTVGEFIVYYLVNEGLKVVTVTAVVYGRRDQLSALTEMTESLS